MLSTMIIPHRGFMCIKCTLALCQNRVLMPIFCQNWCVFFIIYDKWLAKCYSYFGTVTIYHNSLMHVRSKFSRYQNRINWAIFALLNSLWLEIPTDLKSCGEYAFITACFCIGLLTWKLSWMLGMGGKYMCMWEGTLYINDWMIQRHTHFT